MSGSAPSPQRGLTRWRKVLLAAGVVAGVLFVVFSVGAVLAAIRFGQQFAAAVRPAPPAEQTPWEESPFVRLWQFPEPNTARDIATVLPWPSAEGVQELWVRAADETGQWIRVSLSGAHVGTHAAPEGFRHGRPTDFSGDGTVEIVASNSKQELMLTDSSGTRRVLGSGPGQLQLFSVVDFDDDGVLEAVGVYRDAVIFFSPDGERLLEAPFEAIAAQAVVEWDGRRGKELLVVSSGGHMGAQTEERLGVALVVTVVNGKGDALWEARLPNFWHAYGVAAVRDAHGAVVVCVAALELSLRGLTTVGLVGLDETGTVRWRRTLGRTGSYHDTGVRLVSGRFREAQSEDLATVLDDGTLVLIDPQGTEVARHAVGERVRNVLRLPRRGETDALVVVTRHRVVALAWYPERDRRNIP